MLAAPVVIMLILLGDGSAAWLISTMQLSQCYVQASKTVSTKIGCLCC